MQILSLNAILPSVTVKQNYRNIHGVIRESETLSRLFEKSRCLLNLNEKIKNILPPQLIPYVSVANWEGHRLVLGLNNMSFSTELRYAVPDLLKALKFILPEITELQWIKLY